MRGSSRRQFLRGSLAAMGCGMLAGCGWSPLARPAAPKVYHLGWLAFGTPEGMMQLLDALRQGLADLGYVEGRNLAIEARWANRQQEHLDRLAQELVRLKPDVIVTQATPASIAMKQATSTIPIVAVSISDPVGSGLVASFARPDGNLTGLGSTPPELGAKRLQLLKETAPGISRVAIFWNPDNPTDKSTLDVTQQAAQDLSPRLETLPFPVRAAADFAPALQRAADQRADGAVFLAGALIGCCLSDVHDFVERNRIPAIYDGRVTGPDVGGLMSYAPSTTGNYRYAATLVDKVLRGASPGDLPVQQPNSFEFVINTKAATAIGLTFPPSIVAAATEIVEEAARDAHP